MLDALGSEPPAENSIVTTTIDLELEKRLRLRLRDHLADLEQKQVDQASLVVIDNATGDVLAMVGSRDYREREALGAVNASLARRPPGSTLKPFVYALAVEKGAHGSTPVFDVPTSWPGFRPRNAGLSHHGLVSLREALGSSLNVPAVRAADELGVERVAELFRQLGLGSRIDASEQGLALALGAASVRLTDLANAYATLARGGEHLPWRLTDPARVPPARRRLLTPRAAFSISEMLSDPLARRREFGVETPLELPFPAAVKTGTSKSFCDNVVVGYTSEVTVAVWVGNFDGRPMHGLLAMQGAAPLWRDAMLVAMEGRSRQSFEPPPDTVAAEVCPLSGMPRGPHCPAGRHEHVSHDHGSHTACTWHGPDGTLRVPAELRVFSADVSHGVIAEAGPEISIKNPLEGTKVALDPLDPALAAAATSESAGALGQSRTCALGGRRTADRGAPGAVQRRLADRAGISPGARGRAGAAERSHRRSRSPNRRRGRLNSR